MAYQRKEPRLSKLGLVISVVFHTAVIAGLFFFAAREGMLGKQLKKIAVTMVPKEKPPEKPKEKPPEPKPPVEPPKTEEPKVALTPPPAVVAPAAAPAPTEAPAVAPPPAALPSFDFGGGKTVDTTSDPHLLYKSFVEYTLRSAWKRPASVEDRYYLAEVEVAIDPSGGLAGVEWKQGSGNQDWDDSVRKVLAQTKSVGRAPPKGFPEKVRVRFDIQIETDANVQ